ncbi:MAG: DUF91 domain-containing protein [Clostridiales bacterium GWE2_32_10]|nr:MAG: DUF91 domain-containing protein [Clostridiales bacterium GWE2_32_10]HBY19996.1 DUF91 domain-containing protein [Clostridiales bacterium]
MSDIKLFSLKPDVKELSSRSMELERPLQRIIEKNLEEFLGVKFIETEYSTGKEHGGRIDTLGIDENNCPVIIEYKRSLNENVMNQGLYYLDWLLDHKAEFELLVLKKYGKDISNNIEWDSARVVCIAGDFTKYDEHAVKQINRNIELVRYRMYGDDFLLFELVNAVNESKTTSNSSNIKYKTVSDNLKESEDKVSELYQILKDYITSLGDDIQEKTLKYYIAFKRFKNFASIEIHKKEILVYLKLDIEKYRDDNFVRDVTNIGHFGPGNAEIRIKTKEDLEKVKEYILKSYELN